MNNPGIAEISLIGTGGGYGECIVAHIGNNEWIVIDSCQDPVSKAILPVEYLRSKGVSFDNIRLIVCTHWHDDHIRGISQILDLSKNARFSFARANDMQKYLRLVSLDHGKLEKTSSNSSMEEFCKCLHIQEERDAISRLAEIDKILYSTKFNEANIEVYSLSPSSLASKQFDFEISELITQFGAVNKRSIEKNPNIRSIVLLLKLGTHNILLGSDMELHEDPNLGWKDILENSEVVKAGNKSMYFKIPHHGSGKSHSNEVWTKLMCPEPISTLTPLNRGSGLPSEEMVERFKHISKEIYITSPYVFSRKPKKRDVRTTKAIRQFNSTLQEIRYREGIISTFVDIQDQNSEWNTTMNGSAIRL